LPAPNMPGSSTLSPFDHAYVYGAVPPNTVISILPSVPPLQLGLVNTAGVVVISKADAGSPIVTSAVAVQSFASVTVTSYVPATKPVAVAVVCPPALAGQA